MSENNDKWIARADSDVRLRWQCKECMIEAIVPPTFFEDAGTPVCEECGEDMTYVQTLVREMIQR